MARFLPNSGRRQAIWRVALRKCSCARDCPRPRQRRGRPASRPGRCCSGRTPRQFCSRACKTPCTLAAPGALQSEDGNHDKVPPPSHGFCRDMPVEPLAGWCSVYRNGLTPFLAVYRNGLTPFLAVDRNGLTPFLAVYRNGLTPFLAVYRNGLTPFRAVCRNGLAPFLGRTGSQG